MKLLDKKTIHSVTAHQRKSQIDEGVMLAKKIDTLRETLSSLEQQHKLFIEGMQDNLKSSIKELEEEIRDKKSEVQMLEEDRKRLLEPLTDAWNVYKKQNAELETEKEELIKKRAYLTAYNQELNERQQKILKEEDRITQVREEIKIQTDKVVESSLLVQKTLVEAKIEAEHILSKSKIKESDVNKKLLDLAIKERDIEIRVSRLEKEEKEIIKTKAQLEDQRQTLERALKRIK